MFICYVCFGNFLVLQVEFKCNVYNTFVFLFLFYYILGSIEKQGSSKTIHLGQTKPSKNSKAQRGRRKKKKAIFSKNEKHSRH